MQRNKISGENLIALHKRRDGVTPHPLNAINDGRGTPNQAHTDVAAYLRAGMLRGDSRMLEAGRKRCQQLLDRQETFGHMTKAKADESGGDSHWPIWGLGLSSLRLTTEELRGRSPALESLAAAVERWWAQELAHCVACHVPRGPLEGAVVSAGARPKAGRTVVRDNVFQVASGRPITTRLGAKQLAGEAQDTFSAFLAPKIKALPGGFSSALPKGVLEIGDLPLPLFHSPFRVLRYPDGHVTEYPKGMEWQKHVARVVWVRYENGQIGIDTAPPAFDGEPIELVFPSAA